MHTVVQRDTELARWPCSAFQKWTREAGRDSLVAWHTRKKRRRQAFIKRRPTTKDDMISTTSMLSTSNLKSQHLSTRARGKLEFEQLRERALLGTQDSNQGCSSTGVMKSVEGEGKRQFRQLPWRWRTRGIGSVSSTANYRIHHRGGERASEHVG
jgi:hypothetical protein